jgi:DNA-binding response OmpR family regulator
MKFLVIEDDPVVQDAIAASLRHEWPECSIASAANGPTALESLSTVEPELVLLDIGLPGEDGYDVLGRIRRLSDVPVVIVTGRTAEMDEVRGLQLGADDYITKPFESSLLIARLRSLLRRSGRPARERGNADRVAGDLSIDFQTHEVMLRGERVKLTPVEYKLLYHLARTPGRLISHRRLIELVWGISRPSALGRLHVYVKRLRDKLAPDRAPFIENERGLGYRFVRPIDDGRANGHVVGSASDSVLVTSGL